MTDEEWEALVVDIMALVVPYVDRDGYIGQCHSALAAAQAELVELSDDKETVH